jgi:hypothetical protein
MRTNDAEISSRTVILKGLAVGGLVIIFSLAARLGGRNPQLTAFYLVPYVAGILMPLKFTDFAAGMCFGAVLMQLPITLFFSLFGGIFPDSYSFLVMRISSACFLLIGVSSIFAYRQAGSQLGRFFAGLFVSIGYLILAVLILSSLAQ